MQKLIVIVGPTSSGKTKLAVDLARKFNGEIVSADSRQVYRGMDIGTGKDLAEYGPQPALTRPSATLSRRERGGGEGIPHHLIDIVSPRTNFTLAQYQKRAYRAIEDILRRGRVPILVGGTGLYVQAVVDGYVLPDAPPDPKLRAQLAKLSLSQLRAQLKKLDSATFRTIDKNNRRRLERAIEICLVSGVPLSKQRVKRAPPYDLLMFGLGPRYAKVRSHFSVTGAVSMAVLDRRIDRRLRMRLKQGLVKEVQLLHEQGIFWKRLESFGLEYRCISRYLQNHPYQAKQPKKPNSHDRENLVALFGELSRAIKDFARRQMTWFKRDKRIAWIKNTKEAEKLVRAFARDSSRSETPHRASLWCVGSE